MERSPEPCRANGWKSPETCQSGGGHTLASSFSKSAHCFRLVLAQFEHIAEAKASSADMIGRARFTCTFLKSSKSLHFVFFLQDILDQFSCLSLKLQPQHPRHWVTSIRLWRRHISLSQQCSFHQGHALMHFWRRLRWEFSRRCNWLAIRMESLKTREGKFFRARRSTSDSGLTFSIKICLQLPMFSTPANGQRTKRISQCMAIITSPHSANTFVLCWKEMDAIFKKYRKSGWI